MIIGVDYTAAIWQGAGIGRYTRELLRAAIPPAKEFRYLLFYAAGGLAPTNAYAAELRQLCADYPHVRAAPIALSPRLLTILWQRLRLPLPVERLIGKIDLVHAPDFVLPPTRARTILTVHDLTFVLQPDCFEPALRRYLIGAVPRSLRRAGLILADSHATRVDLTQQMGVAAERIAVVYPGVSSRFRPLPAEVIEPVRQRLGLPPAFLLFVGTLEPRKNLVRLVEALPHLTSPLPLVIAGRKGWLYEDIFATVERLGLHDRVIFVDFVEDADLPALYNLAQAFVYPSLYEGFGLPALEALASGTSVVTTPVASLPEVVGAAAILVDPLDSVAIAAGIEQALARTAELRAPGLAQAARFTWEESAQALLTCYRQMLHTPKYI